jgi:endonuclease/exonuclease/phosphatase family metal-dependent hydrolase
MGLVFPLMYVINLLLMFIWLWLYPRRALVHLIPLLICLPHFMGMINLFNGAESTPFNQKTFSVLSYNVRLFDLYNWTENKKTRDSIIQLVNNQNAEIICFQEFFHEDTGKFNTLDTLKQILKIKNVHIEYSAHVKNVNHWGIATFSKYPILKKGVFNFPDETDNVSIFTDLLIGNDTVRIYNLHLESVRFRSEDYKALESITGKKDQTNLDGPQRILSRMRRAYIRRARQTDIISEHISQCPYPVLLCGDFNDPPSSYSYHQISKNLEDSFDKGKAGFGSTYNGLIPFLRIDYLLYDPESFECDSMQVINKEFSDHLPVKAVLRFIPKKTD